MGNDYLTMTEAARSLPGSVSASTVWRWAKHGYRAGERVVILRHRRIGRRMFTSREWLDQFANELTAAGLAPSDVAHPNRIGAGATRQPPSPPRVTDADARAEGV